MLNITSINEVVSGTEKLARIERALTEYLEEWEKDPESTVEEWLDLMDIRDSLKNILKARDEARINIKEA